MTEDAVSSCIQVSLDFIATEVSSVAQNQITLFQFQLWCRLEVILGSIAGFCSLASPSLVLELAVIARRLEIASVFLETLGFLDELVAILTLVIALTMVEAVQVLLTVGIGGLLSSFPMAMLLGRLLDILVSVKVFDAFKAFHEVNDLVDGLIHGIESLLVHFLLPTLWRSEKDDIQEFIERELLVCFERWQTLELVHVNAHEVLKVGSDLHSCWLSAVATNESFGTSQNATG